MTDITYRNVFIDGNKKTSGTTNNFSCLINNNDGFFNLESNEKYYEKIICIPQKFKIMNDFYNISSTGNLVNNQFGFVVSTILNPVNKEAAKIAIPSGYYTVYSLLDWLNENVSTTLNNDIPNIGNDPTTYTYTFTADYDSDKNKYTFGVAVNNNFYSTYNLKMVFQDTTTEGGDLEFSGVANQFLGALTTSQIGMSGTAESPQTLNFLAYPEINIYSNIVLESRENSINGMEDSELLLTIDNNEPKLSYLNFENSNDLYLTNCRPNIQDFTFRITSKDGVPIDFISYPQIYLTFKKFKIYRENQVESILENILRLHELNTLYSKLSINQNL
jgi:hypothetical protein